MEHAKRDLIRHTEHNHLKRLVKKEKNRHILKRLLFINQFYLGDSVPEACILKVLVSLGSGGVLSFVANPCFTEKIYIISA